MRPVALSPAMAPARSRLGKALPGFVLSGLLLLAGTFLPHEMAPGTGSGIAEASTATAKSKKKTTTTTKKHTTHKKSRSKSRYARVRPANYVNARAALLIDAQTGEVLYDKNSGTPMPIASLTKLMTAMVYLESKPDLGKRVMVSREDLAGSGKTQLRSGEVLTMRDLLHASLSPGKEHELDRRRTELVLREEDGEGAPPRRRIDLGSGVARLPRPDAADR